MDNKEATTEMKCTKHILLALTKPKSNKMGVDKCNELLIEKVKEKRKQTMVRIPQGPPLKKNENQSIFSRNFVLNFCYPLVDNSEKIKRLRTKRKEEDDDYARLLLKWCEKRLGWTYQASEALELYIAKGGCDSIKLKELQWLDKEERYNNELLADWRREERAEYEKEIKRVKKELKTESGKKSQYSKYEPIILSLIKSGDLKKKQIICKKIYKAIKDSGFNQILKNDQIPIPTLNSWIRIMKSNNSTSIYKISV